jgi:hypothetical protein
MVRDADLRRNGREIARMTQGSLTTGRELTRGSTKGPSRLALRRNAGMIEAASR